MKNRIKSYSFWTALAGAVVVLMEALGKCFGFSVNNEIVTGVIMAVAGLLVVLGIVTMPNSENKDIVKQKLQEDESLDVEEKDSTLQEDINKNEE